MPIPTDIKYKDALKAVGKCAINFENAKVEYKKGSARRIELFKKKGDKVPTKFVVIHEDKYLYTEDLKKICEALGVTEQQFRDVC